MLSLPESEGVVILPFCLQEPFCHVFPFLPHQSPLRFQLTLKALHFPCKHDKWQDSVPAQTVVLTLLTLSHLNFSVGGICLQLLHSSEALQTESYFYTISPRQGEHQKQSNEPFTLDHLLGLRDGVKLDFKLTPGDLQLR